MATMDLERAAPCRSDCTAFSLLTCMLVLLQFTALRCAQAGRMGQGALNHRCVTQKFLQESLKQLAGVASVGTTRTSIDVCSSTADGTPSA
jgi:hypothetical protein